MTWNDRGWIAGFNTVMMVGWYYNHPDVYIAIAFVFSVIAMGSMFISARDE